MIHTVGCSLAAARLPDWVGLNPTRVGPGSPTATWQADAAVLSKDGAVAVRTQPGEVGRASGKDKPARVTTFAGGLCCADEACRPICKIRPKYVPHALLFLFVSFVLQPTNDMLVQSRGSIDPDSWLRLGRCSEVRVITTEILLTAANYNRLILITPTTTTLVEVEMSG